MKYNLSLLVILICLSACDVSKKREARLVAKIDSLKTQLKKHENKFRNYKALKKLRKNKKDFRDITWYRNSYFIHNGNSNNLSILIGDNTEKQWLNMYISYNGNKPIFFKKVYLSYKDNTRKILVGTRYTPAKNDNGTFWETVDVPVPNNLKKYLRKFANSPVAKVRLSGKFAVTRKLTLKEKKGILEILNGFKALENQ